MLRGGGGDGAGWRPPRKKCYVSWVWCRPLFRALALVGEALGVRAAVLLWPSGRGGGEGSGTGQQVGAPEACEG